jgi:hypothetical protein
MALEAIFGAAHAHRGLLKLTALRFDNFRLVHVGPLLQNYIALESLQHLQLLRCTGFDPFLEELSHKCCALHSFALEHCWEGKELQRCDQQIRQGDHTKATHLEDQAINIFLHWRSRFSNIRHSLNVRPYYTMSRAG